MQEEEDRRNCSLCKPWSSGQVFVPSRGSCQRRLPKLTEDTLVLIRSVLQTRRPKVVLSDLTS
ncbi:hypothetical protein RchiOBHm_Chr2g0114831 [Rosa chinensis]|uniref:Uncharacterized protein n=1 Tax=Rosa chinensis TaxID=74649 RepID=A0A2P6RQV2_ROSCH|nr:hypothetical protein RchiOBHm_Chr2g0114831 [Rosa chinensis]